MVGTVFNIKTVHLISWKHISNCECGI